MSKNDYFVLVYRILAYLYECLKEGEKPDSEYLTYDTKEFPVGEEYWSYIFENLLKDGYIEGVTLVPILGQTVKGVKLTKNIRITPKGIDYLQNNSAMSRANDFLKTIKEIVPGL